MKNKYLPILSVSVIVLILYLFFQYKDKDLIDNGRFTVVEINKFSWPSEGGKTAELIFKYKNITHYASFPLNANEYDKFKLGMRFFMKFSTKNPSTNGEIIFGIKVPDTLTYIPNEGWKEIPKIFLNGNPR